MYGYAQGEGFDDRFHHYCGDSDFAARAMRARHPCYRLWWPLVYHDEHVALESNPELEADKWRLTDQKAFADKWGASPRRLEMELLGGFMT